MAVDLESEGNPQPFSPTLTPNRGPQAVELDYDSTVADLVRCNDTSVRLYNCVAHDPELAQISIREYLVDPEVAFWRTLKTRNLGKKTALELRSLIEGFSNGRTNRVYDVEKPSSAETRDVILALLRQFKFPDAPLQLDISVRLRNVLEKFAKCQRAGKKPGVKFLTLADIVERWPEAVRALGEFKNIGKTSFNELERAIENLLYRRLAQLIPDDRLPDRFTLGHLMEHLDPQFAESLLNLRSSLPGTVINPSDPQFVLENGIGIREQIERIIDSLSQKEKDVLCRRFGLHGYQTKTLEEIGKEFYVTRERVRQVEAGAIRRLKVGPRRVLLKYLLDLESNALWHILSLGSELLLPEDLEQRHRDIDPIQQLAITVVYGDLDEWVSKSGAAFGAGWIRTDRPVETLRAMVAAVEEHLTNLPFPRSVGGIAEVLDIAAEDVTLAVRATGRFRIFEDYVLDGFVGPVARRTVRFHKIFLEHQNEHLLDFTIAVATYQNRYPEDDVGSHIFELQMRRAPHLFASIFDAVWLPLSDQGATFCRRGTIRYNTARSAPDREFDDDSIRNWLLQKLQELGPSRAVDLRDRAVAEFGPTLLPTSIQATLVMQPTFIRLAPGVFGLQEHLASFAEGAVFPNVFFSSSHCRYYILARKAEEPINLYPCWNFGFEAQLCRWSKLHHPNDLYRSLLHVSMPENWPVSEDERSVWKRVKSIYGRYELDPVHASTRDLEPPAESHVLAAVAIVGTLGGLSWISINRAAHRRLDNAHAVAGLALLVALNAIRPTQQWQERHSSEADHSAVFARMASERNRTAVPRWNRGSLRLLLEEALVRLPDRDLGWIDKDNVRTMIEGMLREPTVEVPAFAPTEPDEIFGSDWASQFNQ